MDYFISMVLLKILSIQISIGRKLQILNLNETHNHFIETSFSLNIDPRDTKREDKLCLLNSINELLGPPPPSLRL